MDETVFKRDEKGKKVSRETETKVKRIKFREKNLELQRMIKIGRDDDNDIVIKDDPLVSRRHALIEQSGNEYYIQDKDSTNGTFVNNNPVPRGKKVQLSQGDVVMVGKTKLQIL